MADKRKISKSDPVVERLNADIMDLIKQRALTTSERADMYALARFMHVNDRESSEAEYLYMYLNEDRDWEQDFRTVFGHEPGVEQDR